MIVCGGCCVWNVGATGAKYAVCGGGCGAYPGGACAAVLPFSIMDSRPSNSLTLDYA